MLRQSGLPLEGLLYLMLPHPVSEDIFRQKGLFSQHSQQVNINETCGEKLLHMEIHKRL